MSYSSSSDRYRYGRSMFYSSSSSPSKRRRQRRDSIEDEIIDRVLRIERDREEILREQFRFIVSNVQVNRFWRKRTKIFFIGIVFVVERNWNEDDDVIELVRPNSIDRSQENIDDVPIRFVFKFKWFIKEIDIQNKEKKSWFFNIDTSFSKDFLKITVFIDLNLITEKRQVCWFSLRIVYLSSSIDWRWWNNWIDWIRNFYKWISS